MVMHLHLLESHLHLNETDGNCIVTRRLICPLIKMKYCHFSNLNEFKGRRSPFEEEFVLVDFHSYLTKMECLC